MEARHWATANARRLRRSTGLTSMIAAERWSHDPECIEIEEVVRQQTSATSEAQYADGVEVLRHMAGTAAEAIRCGCPPDRDD